VNLAINQPYVGKITESRIFADKGFKVYFIDIKKRDPKKINGTNQIYQKM